MDPTRRSGSDFNGGQTGAPSSDAAGGAATTGSMVAGSAVSSSAANPGVTPTQPNGISSMTPPAQGASPAVNPAAFTSRRYSNSGGNAGSGFGSATGATISGNLATSGGFGSATGGFGSATGDIVLNPEKAPKPIPKKPLIIGGIIAAVLAVAGIVGVVMMNNSKSSEEVASETAEAASSRFWIFFNYLHSGEEKTDVVVLDDIDNDDSYTLYEMLESDDTNTRREFFLHASELWSTFASNTQELGQNIQETVSSSNSSIQSFLLISGHIMSANNDLLPYYKSNGKSKTQQYITNFYAELTTSEYEIAKQYGEAYEQYYLQVILPELELIKENECLQYEPNNSSKCPSYDEISDYTLDLYISSGSDKKTLESTNSYTEAGENFYDAISLIAEVLSKTGSTE